MSNDIVIVTWTAPTYTGGAVITDYDLRWSSDNGTTWTEETDTTEHRAVSQRQTFPTWPAAASYVFSVRAQNSVGQRPLVGRFQQRNPARPRARRARASPTITPGQRQGDSVLDGAGRQRRGHHRLRTWSTVPIPALRSWVIGSPLRPPVHPPQPPLIPATNGHAYDARVKARNSVGQKATGRLPQRRDGAPARPRRPTPPSSPPASANWRWHGRAPDDHGSPINNYDVRYRTIGASNWSKADFDAGVVVSATLTNETSPRFGRATPLTRAS